MKKFYFLLLGLSLFSGVNAQIINFPDANFKAVLLAADISNGIAMDVNGNNVKIDTNNDGEIQITEASVVRKLKLNDVLFNTNYNSLVGIRSFANLEYLDCSQVQRLSQLDVSNMISLIYLNCDISNMYTLILTGANNLQELHCRQNPLTNLNLSGLSNLKKIDCGNNGFTSLDCNSLTSLEEFNMQFSQVASLDLSKSNNLIALNCNNNSQLTFLNLKNCANIYQMFTFNWCPNLTYICTDDLKLSIVQQRIIQYGYASCSVNSYCTFYPSCLYYTVTGNAKYDSINDGCSPIDIIFPNLKLNISNGSVFQSIISNLLGVFSVYVQAGTHTITPVQENPTYFNISPATVNVTFPTQASPFPQDFCVTANGVHPDLEVTILPVDTARPGFDATYKLIYKNKGTNTQSGTVALTFDDAVLDFVSANPTTSNQSLNNLSWDFVNLLPFETREITLTLNVNSPMETPAVSNGDILNYTAAITSVATDETPNDNTFVFNQTVVNSFDPNDKTCLEGATIAPSEVGKYVHYMIRFENNGTANAQNIVVKDMIDTTKFDINTLVPVKGSHSFVTNITAGNKVEFIFENINLPFDNANNDGYVAFKIKTLPSLINGDTFTNSANIYFDYNFPIVTNTATTTIAALATQDFEFSNYFTLYPNPAKDILHIATKQTAEVSSINIYNALGQLIQVISNAKNVSTVDISSLTSGNYFIKINSDKGTSNTKFIKK